MSESEWLTKRQAAVRLAVSLCTIARRGIPWRDSPRPFKIRVRILQLDDAGKGRPRYYAPDVDALLTERPRSAYQKVFVFSRRGDLTPQGLKS
jgi:hypothetical protein